MSNLSDMSEKLHSRIHPHPSSFLGVGDSGDGSQATGGEDGLRIFLLFIPHCISSSHSQNIRN